MTIKEIQQKLKRARLTSHDLRTRNLVENGDRIVGRLRDLANAIECYYTDYRYTPGSPEEQP